jgi:hypothetical protein
MITLGSGESVAAISDKQPVLLVFLRHFGCSFCREAIDDIAQRRDAIERLGVRIVMVHMAPDRRVAEKFFRRFKLFPIDHISDPEKHFYRAFGLTKGNPSQLFGLMNWIRGFESGVMHGRGFDLHNEDIGDGFQMPGVFVLHQGEIKNAFIHQHAWDRPDYDAIVQSCAC